MSPNSSTSPLRKTLSEVKPKKRDSKTHENPFEVINENDLENMSEIDKSHELQELKLVMKDSREKRNALTHAGTKTLEEGQKQTV